MQSAKETFRHWLNQPVLLTIVTPDSQVPVRGIPVRGVIVGETKQSVCFRIADRWEIDIYKSMIRAVEEDPTFASEAAFSA